MRITGIDWTAVIFEDYPAACQFFSKKLGIPPVFEGKKQVMSHFRFPSGQLLEIYGPNNREHQPEKFGWYDGHVIGLDVQNVESSRQKMAAQGVYFTTDIETWKNEAWTMFLGPENHLLQIQTPGGHSPTEGAELLGFSWFGMPVQDFWAAVHFFTQIMELPVTQLEESYTSARFVAADGHMLQLIGRDHPWSPLLKGITIGFEVEDVQLVKKRLEERGTQFIEGTQTDTQEQQFAFFRGPEAYAYALWQPYHLGKEDAEESG